MSTDEHRLPDDVEPDAYRVLLRVDPTAAGFSGVVEIDVSARRDTASIVLNAAELDVSSVSVDGRQVTWTLDPDSERLLVDSAIPGGGRATVVIAYSARYNDKLVGLYLAAQSLPDGTTSNIAVTQMEATHARQVFPCWDEPAFKATFEITVEAPAGCTVLSNSSATSVVELGGGLIAHHHEPTMAISTYLVAVVVGNLTVGAQGESRGVPIRVIHSPGSTHLADFALEVAQHAVGWFEDYFDIAFPAPKLDLVGVPNFSFGAMENHGCVTFRENALLVDPRRATPQELELVATIVAHEIAHMWFGNLVTMEWWEGIWLNEAFATFMELTCTDAFRPDWDVWQRANLAVCEALDTDALAATRPIEYPVVSPSDADDMFDALTYEKGAAVLRMIEGYLGADCFRAGVRRYLRTHSGSNTSTSDLWTALAAESGEPLEEIAASWIRQGGHPLVTATVTDDGLLLEQHVFRYSGTDDRRWHLPVAGTAEVDGAEVRVRGVLSGADLYIELGGRATRLRLNPDRIGCFRIAVTTELVDELERFTPAELLAVVDDGWASVLAGSYDAGDLVVLVQRAVEAPSGTDPTLWRRVASIVRSIGAAAATDLAAEFSRFASAVGSEGGRLAPEAAATAFAIAGQWGNDPETISLAEQRWDDPDQRDAAMAAAMMNVASSHGDVAFVDKLVDRYRAQPDPQQQSRIIAALASVGSAAAAERAVEAALTGVRSQNTSTVLAGLLANPPVAAVAWDAIADRWEEVLARVPASHHDRVLSGVRGIFDASLAGSITAHLDEHAFGGSSIPIAQHMERLSVNVGAAERIRSELQRQWNSESIRT